MLRIVVCLSLLPSISSSRPAEPQAPAAPRAVYIVTELYDAVDLDLTDPPCDVDLAPGNQCTLRAAIQQANFNPGPDNITIQAAGVYSLTLSGANDDFGLTGDLDITDTVTIENDFGVRAIIDATGVERALDVISGTVTLNNLTFRNAGSAGGVLVRGSASVSLTNVTISGNSGGGLVAQGAVTVRNSTISGNSTSGVRIENGGAVTLSSVTVANNSSTTGGGINLVSGSATISNTLVGGNSAATGPDCSGTLISLGYNLIQSSANCTLTGTLTGNVLDTASLIAPLADNGGLQRTHALLTGSPAIDGGNPAGCADHLGATLPTDQRGTPRHGGRCDIGAYELPQLRLSTSAMLVNENSNAQLSAMLDATAATTVTVNYATSDGTALAGLDYTAVAGTLVFTPGVTVLTVTVPITNDLNDEPNETFIFSLSSPVNAMLRSPSAAVITIVDDDEPPFVQFDSPAFSVLEDLGPGLVTATLGVASAFTVTVDYATTLSGTAQAGTDYTPVSGSLTFAPGQSALVISVPISDDPTDEPNETVVLALSNPVNARSGAPLTATLTILDDDDPPAISFSAGAYTVGEAVGAAPVTVTVAVASAFTITANFGTSDGTALAGSDYLTATGVLTFAPGTTSAQFAVSILNDLRDEPDQSLNLHLTNAVNASGTPATATLTIVDDDPPPTVRFITDTYTVTEDAGPALITVALTIDSEFPITVDFATNGAGTASAGADYTPVSGTLIYTPGLSSQSFAVPIAADLIDEATETIGLTISDAVSATLGAPAAAMLLILDDDPPPTVSFSASVYTATESEPTALITVTLSARSELTASVRFTAQSGTATAGEDFLSAIGTLTFTPGITLQVFAVPLLDDPTDEPIETVALSLSTPVNAQLGLAAATLNLLDDDDPPLVRFETAALTVGEGAGLVPVTVTLSAASALTATVNVVSQDGTATGGSDYTPISTTLAFTPGVTSRLILVSIIDDPNDELTETLSLLLSAPSFATLGTPATTTLSIVDNDPPPTAQFDATAYVVAETAGAANIRVKLGVASAQTVTVGYTTLNGTALAGLDYMTATGTLTFAPYITIMTFTVPIIDDQLGEIDETLTVSLTSVSNATFGTPVTATLTILDNDPKFVHMPLLGRNACVPFDGPNELEHNYPYTQANGCLRDGRVYLGSFNPDEAVQPPGDRDYFWFYSGPTGRIVITVANVLQGAQLQLFYRVATVETRVDFDVSVTNGMLTIDYGGPLGNGQLPEGVYYVLVFMPENYTGGQYTLMVDYP